MKRLKSFVGLFVFLLSLAFVGCGDSGINSTAKQTVTEEIINSDENSSITNLNLNSMDSPILSKSLSEDDYKDKILATKTYSASSSYTTTNHLSLSTIETNTWEFIINNSNSNCKFKVYNGGGYVRTVYGNTLKLEATDAADGNYAYVKIYGPNSSSWIFTANVRNNLNYNPADGQCTYGVAMIKNGKDAMPWHSLDDDGVSQGAKLWLNNADLFGFITHNFSSFDEIPVGAILVFDSDFVDYHNNGHVVILSSKSPLKVISMNDVSGYNKYDERPLMNSSGSYDYPHSSRVRYPIGWIEYKLDEISIPSGYTLNKLNY